MPLALRPMRPRDPHEHHRVATTLELFFDLVTVLAIAAAAAGFHHSISEGHGLEGLPRFAFLFMAIWWAWMNFSWFASAFDNDDAIYRILLMVIMGGELIFAGTTAHIFETLDIGLGVIGWIVMRIGMICLWLRAAAGGPDYRRTALRYAVGIALAQVYWVCLYLFVDSASPWFYAIGFTGFAIELAVPVYAESARQTPFHRHHMIERYGLLMIISLGEIVLSVAHGYGLLNDTESPFAVARVATSALVIVFSVWWLYFADEEHMPRTDVTHALLWGYGHVFIYAATAAMGAALAASVDVAAHEAHTTQAEVSRWLGMSMALGSATLWFVRDRMYRLPGRIALALPVMAAVFLIAGFLGLPVWVFAILAVLTVIWRSPPTRADAA
ncbi:MAG: low temperature requirement protein A [Albidovulum sp.]